MTTTATRPSASTRPGSDSSSPRTPRRFTTISDYGLRDLRRLCRGQGSTSRSPAATCASSIGPNGAGKTTVIDAITSLVPATGNATFGLQELLGLPVHNARLGVGRTSRPPVSSRNSTSPATSTSPPAPPRSAVSHACARRTDCPPGPRRSGRSAWPTSGFAPAGALAHGQKQWLEVGMLLVQGAPAPARRAGRRDEPGRARTDSRTPTGDRPPHRVVVVVRHDMDFLGLWPIRSPSSPPARSSRRAA